jgi:hypothetical protein
MRLSDGTQSARGVETTIPSSGQQMRVVEPVRTFSVTLRRMLRRADSKTAQSLACKVGQRGELDETVVGELNCESEWGWTKEFPQAIGWPEDASVRMTRWGRPAD